jgi:hypothetical protein
MATSGCYQTSFPIGRPNGSPLTLPRRISRARSAAVNGAARSFRLRTFRAGFTARFFMVPSVNDPVVVGMASDPKPTDAAWNVVAKRPMMFTHPNGPHRPDPLEMERRMARVALQ